VVAAAVVLVVIGGCSSCTILDCTQYLCVFIKKLSTSTAAMGVPHRTPLKVMMTMNILMATNISQWCPLHTTNKHKDSLHVKELTVLKADMHSIDSKKSNPALILQEIPTRVYQLPPMLPMSITLLMTMNATCTSPSHPILMKPKQILNNKPHYMTKLIPLTTSCNSMPSPPDANGCSNNGHCYLHH